MLSKVGRALAGANERVDIAGAAEEAVREGEASVCARMSGRGGGGGAAAASSAVIKGEPVALSSGLKLRVRVR
jgi:hypothetical protein